MSKDADCRYEKTAMAIQCGWNAYYESRYEEAGSRFRGLIGSGTDPLEAVWGLSAVLRARGRPAEAALLIKRAQRDHTGEPTLDRELGYVASEQKRFSDAAEIFAALVQRDPDSGFTDRRWQAASLRMAGEHEQARQKLDEARTIGGLLISILNEGGSPTFSTNTTMRPASFVRPGQTARDLISSCPRS